MDLNLYTLFRDIQNEEKAFEFLQSKRIFPQIKKCKKKHEMTVQFTSKNTRWVCKKRRCREEIGLRKNTWLEGSTLPIKTIIFFIYCWINEYTSTKFCSKELYMSNDAITDWKMYLREVCAYDLLKNPIVIGGPGMSVEIDESSFSKRKYNRGRMVPNTWVFGGICRETRECFMYVVPNRTKETLLTTVKACIRPGSTIYSDKWKAYDDIPHLEGYDFQHYTVNHSENFVDPETGAHTQNIENLWKCAKMRNKREHGTARQMLDPYLCDFLWRHRHKNENLFEVMLQNISEFKV